MIIFQTNSKYLKTQQSPLENFLLDPDLGQNPKQNNLGTNKRDL